MQKILLFTTTTPRRQSNEFLKPCHSRLAEIAARTVHSGPEAHRVTWLNCIDQFVQPTRGYAEVTEEARQQATREGYDWLLVTDDDELLPLNTIDLFLNAAKTTQGHFFTAYKRNRPNCRGRGVLADWAPVSWQMTYDDGTIFPHGIFRVIHHEPDPNQPIFKVTFGSMCTPYFCDVAFMEKHNLQFLRNNDTDIQYGEGWDQKLSNRMHEIKEPFYIVRDIQVQHYCEFKEVIY